MGNAFLSVSSASAKKDSHQLEGIALSGGAFGADSPTLILTPTLDLLKPKSLGCRLAQ